MIDKTINEIADDVSRVADSDAHASRASAFIASVVTLALDASCIIIAFAIAVQSYAVIETATGTPFNEYAAVGLPGAIGAVVFMVRRKLVSI